MIRSSILLFSSLLLLTAAGLSAGEETLNVISYNIRQDTPGDIGPRDWPRRRDRVTGYLRSSNAGIIGLQEVRHNQLLDVDKALPDHAHVGVGREDGKTAGEYSPIFYNRKTWKLDPLEHGTYWLSDTPDVPNSRTWGNGYTRICTWARLIGIHDPVKGVAIYVYNTHWDHRSQPSRVKSAELMLKTIKARTHQEEPFILMGDLNATTENPAVRSLLGSGLLIDHGKERIRSSSHWNAQLVAGLRIDHIFTSVSIEKAEFQVESNGDAANQAGSDHHPVRLRITGPLPLLPGAQPGSHGTPERGAAADPIPPLNSKGDVYKSEGETDPLIYGSAVGRKKIIMLYLDFPDVEMRIDTRERGRTVLGEGGFQELFRQQSYGKLSFNIEHVHGWRRLSKKAGQYSSKTTESHRDLFVEIFKTYPKVDFRKYDYIVANMPRIGNTAFGERDDLAIPYRGGKINVALNVSSGSPFVLAHETAHCMGLPDLYTYGGVEGPKNPAGPWDIMSAAGRSTGFLGWHRHKLKWLDADRKVYLTKSGRSLELTPLDASSGISMIVVPADDPARPSKVFVIETAQPIRLKDGTTSKPEGVLVYSVDATLATGRNPVVVYPRVDQDKAAYRAGDGFDHEDAPFRLKVLKRHAAGGCTLDIHLKD